MKKQPIIDMERRGGVFVPALSNKKTQRDKPVYPVESSRYSTGRNHPQQIGKILEGIVTDFFKAMRKEMFR